MTTPVSAIRDLIVLVADKSQQMAIAALLEHRYQSLGMRKIEHEIHTHPQRDPGVYRRGAPYLSVFSAQFLRALVVLDAQWDGSPGAERIRDEITQHLAEMGWKDRSEVIVSDPELEVWVWSTSPHVEETLGVSLGDARQFGRSRGSWRENEPCLLNQNSF